MTVQLTDAQRQTIVDIARVIPEQQRDAFLQVLAEQLASVEVGDGSVHTAAIAARRAIMQPGGREAS
jgi:hypothetical protein